jgi:CDP-diacylglycerol--glycerol-3-phosphate 3-phosphatidyltransferase
MEKERIINIPNLLSFYRLLVFPLILFFVFSGNEKLFSIFLCINLITDILDGFIARTFKLQTRFGARLDSLADIGTYILAFCGIFIFKWNEISLSATWIWIFLGAYILAYIVSFIRFRKFPSLHLYSCKIGGYIQGIFFFVLFFVGYYPWLFKFAMGWGILSYLEETAILLILPEMESNSKGLYWVINK